MKNTSLFVFIAFHLIQFTCNSQILISQGGTVTVNGGEIFYDAGGNAGNDGNTDYTITLAPATSGDRVCVDFTYFKTNFMLNLFGANEEDALFIYDGSSATGNDIGKLMGDYTAKTNGSTTPIRAGMAATTSNAAVFTPTMFCATNSSGALTFKFDNTSSPQYPGWEGNVITYTPNDNVGCNIALTADQTSICSGQTVNLTATGTLVSAALNNNFNNSTVGTGWAASSSASFTNSACAAPSIDGSTYLWMQSAAAPRELKTNAMDVSNGGTISFEYRQAKYNSDGSPCEAPDIGSSTTNEGIYVQYSTNGGTSWNTFKYLFSHSLLSNSGTADLYNNGCGEYVTRWTKMTYPIPTAAQTASTQFRWVQPVATSSSTDNWGLDNVVIASPKTTTITIKNLATGAIIGTSSSSPYSIAVSPTTTTTYEATISDGTTSCTSQITITVGNGTTPTFTQVPAICSGATLNALPTTSNNTINGTWAPALNNTATTTYTFTPTAGQCATNTTMTIAVNNSATPTFTQVAGICSGATLASLSTTSNNAINGTWAPALNNTATTTYTFTPTAGQCAVNTTMTIAVNNSTTPTFTQVAAICSGATLTALPTTSSNAINGTWAPALNNTATTTYTFTPTAGQCAVNTTMTIAVNNNTTPTFTQVAGICTGAALAALPTTSNNAINGTWAPALNNTATTTYTFTPNTAQCAVSTVMTINVNSSTTPTFTQVPAICSGATLAALPTTSNNTINGTWAPALNNTTSTTYTFTPTAGQCATNATMTIAVNNSTTPTFTQVAAICSGATLAALPTTSNNTINGTWAPALNNTTTTTYTFTPTAGQCATNTTMTIAINNSTIPTFTQVAAICSGETLASLPTTSDNSINGTWTPALDNTETTTYTFTPAAEQCAITTTMTVTVNNSTTPTFTQIAPICSGTPLSDLPIVSTNNINGVWSPALNNIATTTYTFVPNNGQCAVNTTMTITVNNAPVIQITDPAPVCEPLTVDLTAATITNGSTQGGNFSYWVNSNASTPLTNATAIATSGTYYIQNSVLGCSSIAPVTVIVYSQPIASFTTSFSSISEDNPSCSMINASIGGTTYNWSFGDGQTSSLENPTNTYTITENDVAFEITLTVVSEFGCIDSTKLVLPVEEELIYYIPNSFTPADSRYNQTFNPIFTSGYDADTYQLYIFDRWGTIVFQTKDALEGWDGLHPKTKTLVSDGVYTWKIAFNLKNSGERKEIYGHVNLLK